MPRAANTLREFTKSHHNDPLKIESRMRLFLRAAFGVSCLHSNGIVHRDLKPENILISKDGTPWVADLGIAHVNPEFVSAGVKTMESERLLNRDYYAPEQRFGNATEVDNRADIYALGYILYELLTGSPPVRSSSPALSKTNESFAPLDPIFLRMTAHEKKDRYDAVEDALEDLSLALGWVLATIKGARPAESADIPTMTGMLKSSNEAHRQHGIRIASQLREEALPVLHELTGNARRDVRDAAAIALGEIANPGSLPFLIGCLYSGRNPKGSTFRPAADSAASAIGRYPLELRVRACADIAQPVRPTQLQEILKEAPKDPAYAAVQGVMDRGMLLLEWGETALALLASIDEERTWPDVAKGMNDGSLNSFRARELAPVLSVKHQTEFLTFWINSLKDAWYFDYAFRAVLDSRGDSKAKLELLRQFKNKVERFPGKFNFDKRADLLTNIERAEVDLISDISDPD
jgi:hypothetical protein